MRATKSADVACTWDRRTDTLCSMHGLYSANSAHVADLACRLRSGSEYDASGLHVLDATQR